MRDRDLLWPFLDDGSERQRSPPLRPPERLAAERPEPLGRRRDIGLADDIPVSADAERFEF